MNSFTIDILFSTAALSVVPLSTQVWPSVNVLWKNGCILSRHAAYFESAVSIPSNSSHKALMYAPCSSGSNANSLSAAFSSRSALLLFPSTSYAKVSPAYISIRSCTTHIFMACPISTGSLAYSSNKSAITAICQECSASFSLRLLSKSMVRRSTEVILSISAVNFSCMSSLSIPLLMKSSIPIISYTPYFPLTLITTYSDLVPVLNFSSQSAIPLVTIKSVLFLLSCP